MSERWRPTELRALPRASHELADDAVNHVGRQVGVPAAEFSSYDLASPNRAPSQFYEQHPEFLVALSPDLSVAAGG